MKNLKIDFSAVGDGVADDTSELQAAMDDEASIYIPSGTYKITDDILVSLENKTIKADAGAVLVFDAGKGVKVNAGGFRCDGLSFEGAQQTAVWQNLLEIMGEDAANPICGFILTNLNFETAWGQAILPRYAHHGFIQNIHVHNAGYAALAFESCKDWDVRGFHACDINIDAFWGDHHSSSYGIYASRLTGDDPVSERINVDGYSIIRNPVWAGVDTHGGKDISYRNGYIEDCMYAVNIGVGDSPGFSARPLRPKVHDTTIVYTGGAGMLSNDSVLFVGTDDGEFSRAAIYGGGHNHANFGVLKFYDSDNFRYDDILFVNPSTNAVSEYNSGNTGTRAGDTWTRTETRNVTPSSCGCVAVEPDPEYQVKLIQFDGSTDVLTRGAGLTGSVDGKAFTVCGVVQPADQSGVQVLIASQNNGVAVWVDSNGKLVVEAYTASGTTTLSIISDVAVDDANPHQFVCSVDLSTTTALLYIDGVSHKAAGGVIANNTIDLTTSDWYIGAYGSTNRLNGKLGGLYLATAFVSLTTQAGIEKFWNNGPVDLLASGAPSPLIYLNKDYTDFGDNSGTGGDFTVSGNGLSDGGLYP
jgi:hypothetical protein